MWVTWLLQQAYTLNSRHVSPHVAHSDVRACTPVHTDTLAQAHTRTHTCAHTQTRVHTHAPDFTGILGNRLLWPLRRSRGEGLQLPGWATATRSGSHRPAPRRTERGAQAHGPARGPRPCAGYWRTPDASSLWTRAPHAPLSHGPSYSVSPAAAEAESGSVQGLPAGRPRGPLGSWERSPPARGKPVCTSETATRPWGSYPSFFHLSDAVVTVAS